MRITKWIFTASLLAAMSAVAQTGAKPASTPAAEQASQGAVTTLDQVVDRSIEREHALIQLLQERTPLVETYLQDLKPDAKLGPTPVDDHYFFGRLDLNSTKGRRDFLSKGSLKDSVLGGFTSAFKLQYKPTGFSWMIFVDREDYDRQHYDFSYIRREFLGDVRTIVFDVTPKKGSGNGRFHGRVWIEDQDYNIVRLNGTYEPHPKNSFFFHLDSWRLNLVAGYWVPSYIYSEEGDFGYGSKDKIAFKAQTRIWGYNLKGNGKEGELATLTVDSTLDQSAAAQDASPLEAEQKWQQQAEDNVIDRLERAGLVAPSGELDKVLQTVVANLEITNNIELSRPIRTRLMLTSPLETFSVGNTIVISRGLVDVLPDEASLAAVLSHELAHIVLGHNLGSKFAFNDRMLFSDESSYQNLGFRHIPEEEAAADAKAVELLQHSPYSGKLEAPGLFLKTLAERSKSMQGLLTAHLGNSLVDKDGQVQRLTVVMNQAPALNPDKLDQIAALPLGGRVKVNPWDDRAEMIKTAPIGITSARDKMPLEVTPFYPRLQRLGAVPTGEPATAANTAKPATNNQ